MRIALLLILPVFLSYQYPTGVVNPEPANIIGDIQPPQGYFRNPVDQHSFAGFLRAFELSDDNTVYYYNGRKKPDQESHYAVLKLNIGNKDLVQCADAIMKLRMLFLRSQQKDIAFYDTEHHEYKIAAPYNDWDKYMDRVFSMCGTMSLSMQLHQKDVSTLEIGDVLIKGGFPGHAEIVVDVVENKNGHKKFMLAQGYMPAQSMHIVTNLNDNGSPWFDINETEFLTSGYTFYRNQLKTW
jgi:hypothetical protein